MAGRLLILNDGTIIENGEAGYSQGTLCLFAEGYTLQQAAILFLDPNKTKKIVFCYGEMSKEYDGYTNCTTMMINTDGKLTVCMTKG